MWVALLIFAQLLPLDANKVCIAHSDDGYCESQVGVHFFSVIQLGAAEVVKVSIPQNRFTLATAKPSVTARQPQPEAPSILELLEKDRRTMMGSSWSLPVWPCLGVFAVVTCCCMCSGGKPRRPLLPWQMLPPVSGPSRRPRKAGQAEPGAEGTIDATTSTSREETETCCCNCAPFVSVGSKSVDERPQRRNVAEKTQAITSLAIHGITLGTDAGSQDASTAAESESKTWTYVRKASTSSGAHGGMEQGVPDFSGKWVCTHTWGLDEFLQEQGISPAQRSFASSAAWPTWEFQQKDNHIKFQNRTVIGCMEEEFEVGGGEYKATDMHRQSLKCTAFWEGATLLIIRESPNGKFREERRIDENGILHFQLRADAPSQTACWGRTFKRV